MQPFRHYASPCPRSHALALTRTRTHIHTHILPILSLARPCDAFSSLPNTLTRSALVCISFGSSLCSSTSQPHVPDVAAPQLRSSAARHPASTLFPSSIAPPSCHLKFHRPSLPIEPPVCPSATTLVILTPKSVILRNRFRPLLPLQA